MCVQFKTPEEFSDLKSYPFSAGLPIVLRTNQLNVFLNIRGKLKMFILLKLPKIEILVMKFVRVILPEPVQCSLARKLSFFVLVGSAELEQHCRGMVVTRIAATTPGD